MIKLFDSHAHLSLQDYEEDLEEVLQRASSNNVAYIVNNADSLESFEEVLKSKSKYPSLILIALGIQPEYSGRGEDYISEAIRQIKSNINKMDAIGECGLDFHYLQGTSKEDEIKVFKQMTKLSKEYDKPLIVHSREAFEETYKVIASILPRRVDFHCYSYGKDELRKLLSLPIDIRFAFNGIVTFKHSEELQETLKEVPIERLLLETDSPCLTPVPYRGKRNEPAYLTYVFEKICELKGITSEAKKEEFANFIFDNSLKFFGIE